MLPLILLGVGAGSMAIGGIVHVLSQPKPAPKPVLVPIVAAQPPVRHAPSPYGVLVVHGKVICNTFGPIAKVHALHRQRRKNHTAVKGEHVKRIGVEAMQRRCAGQQITVPR